MARAQAARRRRHGRPQRDDGRPGRGRSAPPSTPPGTPTSAILAYSAKYASAFFGPFREAVDSSLEGDRRTYQQDPANALEGVREALLDVEQGADIVMVKPALGYLDVVRRVRDAVDVPVAAYNVSGEYAMVEAAAAHGWIDREPAILETLTSIRRAGADVVLTYWAAEAARLLRAEPRLDQAPERLEQSADVSGAVVVDALVERVVAARAGCRRSRSSVHCSDGLAAWVSSVSTRRDRGRSAAAARSVPAGRASATPGSASRRRRPAGVGRVGSAGSGCVGCCVGGWRRRRVRRCVGRRAVGGLRVPWCRRCRLARGRTRLPARRGQRGSRPTWCRWAPR